MPGKLTVASTRALLGKISLVASVTMTAASNATPISVTAAAHGLQTGDKVSITGAVGNTAANGCFSVTVVDANTYTLDGSVGNGAWSSGGAVNRIYSALTFSDITDLEEIGSHLSVKRGGASEATVKATVEAQTII